MNKYHWVSWTDPKSGWACAACDELKATTTSRTHKQLMDNIEIIMKDLVTGPYIIQCDVK